MTGRTGSGMIAGCGKDTVGEMICEITGFKMIGLADPLYAMVKAGFGIDGTQVSREEKNAPIPWLSCGDRQNSIRSLLETIGTEWGRECVCNDVWTRIATQTIKNSEVGVVVRDIRFPNEVEWLDSIGGILIHIIRPHYLNPDATVGHGSNIPLPIRQEKTLPHKYRDRVIFNDGTLNGLRCRVEAFCHQYLD